MTDISLSAGMRANLISLQKTSKTLTTTQERLATGRKVNSAVDNPTNYFAASNLQDRARSLTARLDGMGQAVSTLEAADNAISSMRGIVSAMKGVVDEAMASSDSNDRASLGKQFNELLVQLNDLSQDASYKGVNLLTSNQADRTAGATESLTVQFNEQFGESTLSISGVNVTGATGAGTDGVALTDNGEIDSKSDIAAARYTSAAAEAVGSGNLVAQSYAITLNMSDDIDATLANGASRVLGLRSAEIDSSSAASSATGGGSAISFVSDTDYSINLQQMIADIEAFDQALVTTSKNLAQNVNIVSIRQDFTTDLINVLEEGADKLVLADLNEESANLLALQTAQQLGTQSLSLASQANQSVLSLLG